MCIARIGASVEEIDLDSETNWRKLEEYYDSLEYVPVSRFKSRIPFTGPDPRHLVCMVHTVVP